MATHSSTLAWKIPWTEEPGGLQSMGSLRVGHNWANSFSLFTHWRRKWQPTLVLLPGESQGRGAWWTAVYGVAQSRTRLKRLCSSSNSILFKLSNAQPQVSICVPPPIFQSPPTTRRTVEAHELWARWVTIQDGVLLRWKFSGCVSFLTPDHSI